MKTLIANEIELNHVDEDTTFTVFFDEETNKFIAEENSENPRIFQYDLLVHPNKLTDSQCEEIQYYCYGSFEIGCGVSYKEIFLHSKFIKLIE